MSTQTSSFGAYLFSFSVLEQNIQKHFGLVQALATWKLLFQEENGLHIEHFVQPHRVPILVNSKMCILPGNCEDRTEVPVKEWEKHCQKNTCLVLESVNHYGQMNCIYTEGTGWRSHRHFIYLLWKNPEEWLKYLISAGG